MIEIFLKVSEIQKRYAFLIKISMINKTLKGFNKPNLRL